eukprot:811369_1
MANAWFNTGLTLPLDGSQDEGWSAAMLLKYGGIESDQNRESTLECGDLSTDNTHTNNDQQRAIVQDFISDEEIDFAMHVCDDGHFDEYSIWEYLLRNDADLYMIRKHLVMQRIAYKLRLDNHILVTVDGDGNCLLNAYCEHIYGDYLPRVVQEEREKIVQYTVDHPSEFPTLLDPEMYRRNREYLLTDHILALHQVNRINMVLFQYIIER